MRTYDFAPLFRSTVGFDRLFDPTFLPLRIRQPECPRKLRASTAALDLWC